MFKTAFLQKGYLYLFGFLLLLSLTSTELIAQTTALGISTLPPNSVRESDGAALATVTRAGNNANPLTVTLSLAPASATETVNIPASVEIPANSNSATFDIIILDDNLVENNKDILITAEADGQSATVLLTVTDDDTAILTLTPDISSFPEDTGISTVTVMRNTSTITPLTVSLISNDTGEATVPATVTIPVGQASTTFQVSGVDDRLVDGDQNVSITATANGFPSTGIPLTVRDDDIRTLTLTMVETRFSEKSGVKIATLSRNTVDLPALAANLSTVPAIQDEITFPSQVTFPLNISTISFTVTPIDDTEIDGTQTITLEATAAGFIKDSIDLDILDDESPQLFLTLERTTISENGDSTVATVSRNTDTSLPLTVNLSSSDENEATVSPASVEIPAGLASANFTVNGVDDVIADGPKTVTLSATGIDFPGPAATADLTVNDDDVAGIRITETGGGTLVSESGLDNDTFSVTLSAQPGSTVTLNIAVDDPGEASVDMVSLTFDDSNWNDPKTVTVTGVDDIIEDGNQFSSIIVSVDPDNSDDAFDAALSQTVSVLTTDDETDAITVNPISGLITTESGAQAMFDVVLNSAPGADVELALDSDDLSEGTVDKTALTFTSADWFVKQTITITGVNDDLVDGSILYNIVLNPAVSDDMIYDTMDPVDVSVINIDDDTVGFTVVESAGDTVVAESGSTDTVQVLLNTAPTSSVVITIDNANPVEVSLSQTSLTFTTANWNIPQTVTLATDDDADADGNQSVALTFAVDAANSDDAFDDLADQIIIVTTIDNDSNTLTLRIPQSSISESGGSTLATVSRSTGTTGELTVNLSSDDVDGSELMLPLTPLTILDGSSSVQFELIILDDNIIDGTQTVTVTASADLFDDGSDSIAILDDDLATLTLSVNPDTITEGGNTTATVTRVGVPTTSPLTVVLSSSDSTEATLPASVQIPAGQISTTATVSAIDDLLVDGNQTVTLSANAFGFNTALTAITINDDDDARLTLDIVPLSISEQGGIAIATLTRNFNIANSLNVGLISDDVSEVNIPAGVILRPGQTTTTFAVVPLDDKILDGNQQVTITASADTFTASEIITIEDAGTPGNLTLQIDSASIAESGGSATATVSRDSEPNEDLIVALISSDLSEAVVPGTVTIPAGETTATFPVNAVDDNLVDGNVSVTITASALNHLSGSASVSVTDDDVKQLTLSINPTKISENGGVALAVVTRNTPTNETLEVTLISSDTGEAIVPDKVTIAIGDLSAIFAISGADDGVIDGDQIVTIGATATDFIAAEETITISDDETPQLSLFLERTAISENGDQTTGIVTRNTVVTDPLSVTLTSSDTGEAVVTPETIIIPAGQSQTRFDVMGIDENIIDGTQAVTLTASATDFADGIINLNVLDDDTAGILLSLTGGSTLVSESMTTDTFDVVLTAEPASDVVLSVVSTDTGEVTVDLAGLTFTPNDWDIPQTITVTGVDDAEIDGAQQTAVIVSVNPALSDPGFANAPAQTMQVTTTDDDQSGITVIPISGLTTTEAGGTALFDVVLDRQPTDSVTITLNSDDPSEGAVTSLTPLTFQTNDWNMPQTVTVTGVDDLLVDGSIAYNIVLNPAESNDNDYDTLDPVDVAVTNLDDDASDFSVIQSDGNTQVSEDGVTDTISVVLNRAPISSVVFFASSANTDELILDRALLTFTPGNWNIPQLITVSAVDDDIADGNQMVDITVSVDPANSEDSFDDLPDQTVTATTIDNEVDTLTLNITRNTVSEGGVSTLATVSRNSPTTNPLSVTLVSDDTSEITVASPIIIAAGADSVEFELTIIDDNIVDDVQTVTITASAVDHLDGSDSIAVLDNDLPSLILSLDATSISENGGSTQASVTRTLVQPTALIVSLTSSDSGEATVPASVTIPANQATATFTVNGVDDNLVDGTQLVTLTANAASVTTGLIGIEVEDDDIPTLTLSINPAIIEETGNSAAIAVISRNTETNTALEITLINGDSTEISIPASVIIPVGASSATFPVNARDDAEIDGDQLVSITASAAGFAGSVVEMVQVLDSGQTGRLILDIEPGAVPEDGSVPSAGTVTRNGDTSNPLVVVLNSNDLSEVTVPATVTIPAGQISASFDLTIVNDNIVDGAQTVIISATAPDRPTAVSNIIIIDDDGLSLTLTVNFDRLSENGGFAVATVTRNTTDLKNPLTVTMSVDLANQINISEFIVIPADQATTTFIITGIDDKLSEEDTVVTITASAPDYLDGSVQVTVLDDEPIFTDQFEQ